MSMTQQIIDKCIKQTSDSIICQARTPVHDLHYSTNTPCEANLIGQSPIQSTCTTETLPCVDNWIKLQTHNTWLAICCDSRILRTICDNELVLHTLKGSSIVTMAAGCILQINHLVIYSQNQYNNSMIMDPGFLLPTMNLNSSINAIVGVKLRGNVSHFYEPDTSHMAEIRNKIELQKRNEDAPLARASGNDSVHYTIIYSIMSVSATALVIYALVRNCCCRYCGATARAPAAPRPRPSDAFEMRQMKEVTTGNDNISFNFD